MKRAALVARKRAALATAAAVVVLTAAFAPGLGAAEPNRAAVVVRMSEANVRSACVAFTQEEITGADLLARSGLDVVSEQSSVGTAMCMIDGTGCDRDDCFCRYPTFWGYWTRENNRPWRFSDVGSADRKVRDGSIDGWSFGKDGKPAPPRVAFADVCTGDAGKTITPVSARAVKEPTRTASDAPNYLPFVALVAVLVVLAALVVRRRRTR